MASSRIWTALGRDTLVWGRRSTGGSLKVAYFRGVVTSADKGFGCGYFDYLASVKDPRHI